MSKAELQLQAIAHARTKLPADSPKLVALAAIEAAVNAEGDLSAERLKEIVAEAEAAAPIDETPPAA